MPSANSIRVDIEASLTSRFPGALAPMQAAAREITAFGIEALDRVMHGGVPSGVITEFVGSACSGRTSLALAYVAATVRCGTACAWVDVGDGLCPEDAAANNVDLDYLLWVRCGSVKHAAPSSVNDLPIMAKDSAPSRNTYGGSPHPRSEAKNMPEAISGMLKAHGGIYDQIRDGQIRREKKSIGTPGQPNRPVDAQLRKREEQVNSDRMPPRRGENLSLEPRCATPQPRRTASTPSSQRLPIKQGNTSAPPMQAAGPYKALDQAIKATDLLLQAGGFSAIVLDMGSIPAEMAWRIPLATWFRFRAACERTGTGLMLLTQHSCARSSAELVVRLDTGSMESQGRVMTGIRYRAAMERSRMAERQVQVVPIRKPPQSEQGRWTSETSWAR